MSDSTVAKTILEQMGGSGRIVAMTGAKNFIFDVASVSFRWTARRGPNHCTVTLRGDDTYDVTFGRLVKYELRETSTASMVYADQLVPIFESTTGIFLSL